MTPVRAMIALLQDERQLLMTGDYAAMDGLLRQKIILSGQLDGVKADAELPELARQAARNADMIAAARHSFESARSRIRDIREGRSQSTYGRDGSRQFLSKAASRIEQKF